MNAKRDTIAVRAKLDALLHAHCAQLLAYGAADKEAFLEAVLRRAEASAQVTRAEHA
jgi:hypothetical protein